MVGVPRSKGCRICVQRRVKCDQTRPVCNNCLRGNRPCPGYDTDLRIQDEGFKLRKRFGQGDATDGRNDLDKPSPSSTSTTTSTTTSGPSQSSGSSPEELLELVSYQGSPRFEDQQGYRVDVILPPHNVFFNLMESHINPDIDLFGIEPTVYDNGSPTMDPANMDAAFGMALNSAVYSPYLAQEQLLCSFTSAFTTHKEPHLLPPQLRTHSRWLSQLPAFFGTNLIDAAVRAVSLVHLGRAQKTEALVQESRQFYGKALRLLNQSLSDQSKGLATETLSATVLLSFYEMLASESNASWVRHAGGAGALMRIRGPKRHLRGVDRDLFLAYRHTIVIDAFQRDEACFLAEPEWLEMSHQVHEDLRSSGMSEERMEIFDLAEEFYREHVHVPGTLRDVMKLPHLRGHLSPAQYAVLEADVLKRCHQHRANLKTINMKFRVAMEKIGFNTTTIASNDPVFPTQYVYINVFVGSTHVGHWTILMLLNLALKRMEETSAPEMTGLYLMENRELAREICRSTLFMMTSSFLGPFFIIFALRLCLMVLEPGLEREWVFGKLMEIGDTRMRMASDLRDFEPEGRALRVQAVDT